MSSLEELHAEIRPPCHFSVKFANPVKHNTEDRVLLFNQIDSKNNGLYWMGKHIQQKENHEEWVVHVLEGEYKNYTFIISQNRVSIFSKPS